MSFAYTHVTRTHVGAVIVQLTSAMVCHRLSTVSSEGAGQASGANRSSLAPTMDPSQHVEVVLQWTAPSKSRKERSSTRCFMLSGAVYGELHQRIKARIVCSRDRVCCRWGMAWVGVYKSNSQTLGDMPQQLLVVAFLALCFRGVQCDYCNGYQSSREFRCELGSETCCGSSDITDSGTYWCYCDWDGSTDWCQYSCTRCQQCNYVSCVECGTGTYTAGCSGGSSGYCASCGTPPSGQYWSSGCTSSACTSCPANQYTSGCGGTSAGSCAGCSY